MYPIPHTKSFGQNLHFLLSPLISYNLHYSIPSPLQPTTSSWEIFQTQKHITSFTTFWEFQGLHLSLIFTLNTNLLSSNGILTKIPQTKPRLRPRSDPSMRPTGYVFCWDFIHSMLDVNLQLKFMFIAWSN